MAQQKCYVLSLHNWVFSSLSYMPMHAMLKRKICKENKRKKNQNAYNMIVSMFLGDVRVIRCTSKVIVPIKQLWLCVSVFVFSLVSNHHNLRHLCNLAMFHTQQANSLLFLIHVQVQCDLAITRNTYVDICSLNYLDLFLKYKIG